MKWLAELPSTNARIVLTLLLALATGCRVIALGWDPPETWLVFLTVWSGIDVAQYLGKRMTYQKDA